MDGHYPNDQATLISRLQDWVKSSIETHAWERADDIHIDEIDPQFSKKLRWVEDALNIGRIFAGIVHGTPYTVLLAIQLAYSDTPSRIDEFGINEIQNDIYNSPPSFYLLPRNDEILELTLAGLRCPPYLQQQAGFPAYFKELQEEGEGYFRVVFFLLD